ncbi:Lpg1974 family pore-forming outer membrane protein [Estrella lausannensis]|uniref:Outer membrane protein n=1 Tax=Estrella lausannensis TaxID=483423 RepID=A0A0H5DR54_9BACT|nr:Lpg1974 family pore-forming outer membrane protein [Estrella lausannensis]CRX38633.1 Outer membrane protein [Estrella lausannensis]
MKKIPTMIAALAIGTAVGGSLSADDGLFCLDLQVRMDTLAWKPCVDDLDFAATVKGQISDVDNPRKVDYHSICPDWDLGYRINLKKASFWNCFDFHFSYTWFRSHDSSKATAHNGERIAAVLADPTTINEAALFSGDGFFDTARAKWKMLYQSFDFVIARECPFANCQSITPFFGFQYLKFDQKIKGSYFDTQVFGEQPQIASIAVNTEWQSLYKGAGLKIGTAYTREICHNIKLFGAVSGSLLVGDNHISVGHGKSEGGCCHVMSLYHLQAGIFWKTTVCGIPYELKAGYEFLSLNNIAAPRRYFESVEVSPRSSHASPRDIIGREGGIAMSTPVNVGSIGFHGLTAGFNVTY